MRVGEVRGAVTATATTLHRLGLDGGEGRKERGRGGEEAMNACTCIRQGAVMASLREGGGEEGEGGA